MPNVRVATFNCENLFARFKFEKDVDVPKAAADGFTVEKLKFDVLNGDEKKLTAEAIAATKADVIALQEVDSHDVLRRFRNEFLKNKGYTHTLLVDGNDPRHIDVAILSKVPIVHARSYHHLRSGSSFTFSRDCLEVDVEKDGKRLTLFVNHLKSMMGGRAQTKARRKLQAEAVRKIVEDRFGTTDAGLQPWVVLGDLNDYLDGKEGIGALTGWSELENVLDRLPAEERWTHFFDREKEYRQLDYLLVSKGLAAASGAAPVVVRQGLSLKATEYTGPRFPEVTKSKEASDHCPLAFDITL